MARAGISKDYDASNVDSVVAYSNNLIEKTLSELTGLCSRESHLDYTHVKGKFGQCLEKEYFGLTNNSDCEPDFKKAGVELKSTPLKKDNSGKLSAKERLVLNIINYEEIVNEDWRSSTFLKKNHLLLLIFYLYESDKSFLDFLIKYVKLWRIQENDVEIIRQDWETIVRKIKEGKAHELSEGDTFYLSACRKGSGRGRDLRAQPNSNIRALQRAFSFKAKYMNSIIKKIEDSEPIIKERELIKSQTFEEVISSKFVRYYNSEVSDIEAELGVKLDRSRKDFYAILAREVLGIKKKRIEEFEKAEVSMKIIRLKEDGTPKEDMSFPRMTFREVVNQKWEESEFYEDLTKKFFFVVYQIKNNKTYLKKAFFWNIPSEDIKQAEIVWKKTQKLLKSGLRVWAEGGKMKNNLPKSFENGVSHVRPHARNRNDTDTLPDGRRLTKQCFWLNSLYLKKQIGLN